MTELRLEQLPDQPPVLEDNDETAEAWGDTLPRDLRDFPEYWLVRQAIDKRCKLQ